MQLDGLASRRVLVTGAGSSVGRVIAEKFIAEGARVHIADVNADLVAQTTRDVKGITGSACDVGDAAQVAALIQSAGDVDFLVNCVGVAGPAGTVEQISSLDWRKTFDTNVHGIFETMRLTIAGMKVRRFGVIVNFSTANTKTGLPGRAAYVAGKAAVEALTYTAARELGPHNVRCNAILPGPINNERMNRVIERSARERGLSFEQTEKELLRYVSMHERVEPSELADMVLFLCSGSGRHITGQMIEVSGNLEWEE